MSQAQPPLPQAATTGSSRFLLNTQVRKPYQRHPVIPLGAPVQLDANMAVAAGDEQHDTPRQIETMWEALLEVGHPITMLHAVLDPLSFGETVENAFALSFLVRDQRVRLYINEADGEYHGAMMVEVIRHRLPQHGGGGQQSQFVVALDFEDWVRARLPVRRQPCQFHPRTTTQPALTCCSFKPQELLRGSVRPEDCLMAHRAEL